MMFSNVLAIFAVANAATPVLARNLPLSELSARLATGRLFLPFFLSSFTHRNLPAGPNAKRMALGLPPLSPTRIRRYSKSIHSFDANLVLTFRQISRELQPLLRPRK
jgi:hypothetical protein